MSPSLIIVSNRLPVSVKKTPDGELDFYPSIGGLATGLASYATNKRNKWIGWPGVASEDVTEKEKQIITHELANHNCYPVFLTRKQLDDYYNGYSNSILWPLFHDVPIAAATMKNRADYWKAYRKVNAAFADVTLALSTRGSRIWVHDYQLLLLPALLRKERPNDKIGFFLHIPFPGFKSFSKLDYADALLAGMLGADLLGFHTESYVQNFLSCCQEYDMGLVGRKDVILQDRVVRVTDFPMGIDYTKWTQAAKTKEVRAELAKFRVKYLGLKVILTVDRLDPTKGLVERAAAYKEFLVRNPQLRGKVVMVMLAVPSRTEIDAYKKLRTKLEALVDDINATFGTRTWQPVDYLYQSMPFAQLTALYQRADVAFIAPLRDGMNLVAKEYLAAQTNRKGVLVLSKTAGAAQELQDAVMVDPSKPSSLVRGLTRALTMPEKELKERVGSMQDLLSTATVQNWAGSFMKSLKSAGSLEAIRTPSLNDARRKAIVAAFRAADSRLLFLDYDGVLAPLTDKPDKAKPSQNMLKILEKLAKAAKIVIVSGRHKDDLEAWLGDLPVALVAEHGAFTREAGKKRWHTTEADVHWKDRVLPILEKYAALTPGAWVEDKDSAIVWHYRNAKTYYAQKHLVILKKLLTPLARSHKLSVQQGNKILEVRPEHIDKGQAVLQMVDNRTEFVLAIGDDYTDEDMFESLPPHATTIKVGRGRTAARYRAQNVAEVMELLKKLRV
ncbi:MAG TPA: bifunctional alpha,alpha-trehalose-phosphate synthase (UDP-forming)/trehalose-phosphatase [Candidatus Saccharimonadales bacterium]|nr:bifunctional alpha,alpha-trehalose-phosphate synthase (UDP-forming)/trehalose-phosphatase [Candidatus Saccharimonadales bacterium]